MSEAKFTRDATPYVPPAQPAPQPVPQPPAPAQIAPPPPAATEGSLDLTLPDGRVVVMERPNAACQFAVYRILSGVCPDGNPLPGLNVTVKSLMYISSINGVKKTRPFDHVEAQTLMNELGDEGTEIVAGAYLQHFLLQKKNLPLSDR